MPFAEFLGIDDPQVTAAVIAAAVALVTTILAQPLRYVVDRRLQKSQAETDFEIDHRRALREKIGVYHGRLLETAVSLHLRLGRIYEKRDADWIDVNGIYDPRDWGERYFYPSSVYRFMAFTAIANRFERDAIF